MENGGVGDSESAPVVGRVVIIGVGLMGGSLGMALIQHGAAEEVVGIDSAAVLDAAIVLRAIHRAGGDVPETVAVADLVVIAAPIHTIPGLLEQIAPYIASHATVTDLASVKSCIAAEGERLLGERFVGGHPMAGSEQTGIRSAHSTLFKGAAWALTPSNDTQCESRRLEMLCELVRAIGATPLMMGPVEHDRAAALISHLPHLICYAYNQTVDASPLAANALSLAAGSYRDLTRVAASDPVLWRDVFIENREYLLEMLRAYMGSLKGIEDAIKAGDPNQVLEAVLKATRSQVVRRKS